VSESFSLSRSECSPISDPSLRTEISRHTGNEDETSRILRSLERFGGDSSILRYDITPKENGRFAQKARTVAWSVRAVRADRA
jgi:hypothetical protein